MQTEGRPTTRRLALAFAVVLLGAAPVLAQGAGRELEFGGGWFQHNPLGIDDISVFPSGPSVNLAWTTWRNERTGITVGVTSVLARVEPGEGNDVVERAFATYGHVTWRRRWSLEDGKSFFHFGLGIGPTFDWETRLVRKWNPEVPTWFYDGETEAGLRVSYIWHAELLATRRLRDGLDLRAGVTFTPVPVPMTAQPVVMVVWGF